MEMMQGLIPLSHHWVRPLTQQSLGPLSIPSFVWVSNSFTVSLDWPTIIAKVSSFPQFLVELKICYQKSF